MLYVVHVWMATNERQKVREREKKKTAKEEQDIDYIILSIAVI